MAVIAVAAFLYLLKLYIGTEAQYEVLLLYKMVFGLCLIKTDYIRFPELSAD